MISVGHKTGLFDAMATLPPSTSEQIARKAKLNERYVREWLGSMVTGKIVEYDSKNGTYKLPAEHAAAVTRTAGIDNLATIAQYLSLCGEVEEQIAECFRKGGGVPYSAYPRFTELMSEGSSKVQDARLVDTILPLVDGLVDRLWKGISVLDVGCGSGHAINLMAKAFPNSRFAGYDFSRKGIAAARAEAKRLKLNNARFAARDVATLNEPRKYDLITAFDSIHDQAKPTKVLKAISKGLRPNGVFLMVDVAASSNLHENLQHPLGPFLYSISTMHCMTVSLAYRGEGLGTVWGEQLAKQKLNEAGFKSMEIRKVPGDILNSYYIARKT
jgi:ubiquinone/menaquinone biosynthesis C-methylase UbiE